MGWEVQMMCRWLLPTAFAAVALLALPGDNIFAQTPYPSRPIRLIVASAPGGVHDVIARLWADGVKSPLGTMVIDNRGGGGGTIGVVEAARAQPDGYTLLLGSNSTHILVPLLSKQPGFDPVKDFELVSVFALTSTAIAVHPGTPFKTLKELVAAAEANPGKLSYAHAGHGSISNVAGELFKQLAGGLNILPVPYKGMGPAQMDVVNGTVSMFVPNITGQVIGLHQSAKFRILAVNAPARHPGLPDIPTAIEAGLPGMITQNFFGIFAPAGTPKVMLERVDQATQAVLGDGEFQKRLSNGGFEPLAGFGPAKSAGYMRDEYLRWQKVIKSAGI
jgi:tripartite-type tricarboxylate transporter receptor subunit TctC